MHLNGSNMFGRGNFRSHSLSQLYRRASVDQIISEAISSPRNQSGDDLFAAFQVDRFHGLFAPLKIDSMAISLVETDTHAAPLSIDCVLYRLDPAILENYERIAEHDLMAPIVYANPGKIISHEEIISQEKWLKHPFYLEHCALFEIHSSMMINFRVPGRDFKHVTLEYLGGADNQSFRVFNKKLLELGSLPFALSWLFRQRFIDEPKYKAWMSRLVDLTSTQLTFLRTYVSKPEVELSEQARQLGLMPASYKRSLYEIRGIVEDRWSRADAVMEKPGRKSLRPFDAHYGFLRMLCDPTSDTVITG